MKQSDLLLFNFATNLAINKIMLGAQVSLQWSGSNVNHSWSEACAVSEFKGKGKGQIMREKEQGK